jgi:hypothetical protein
MARPAFLAYYSPENRYFRRRIAVREIRRKTRHFVFGLIVALVLGLAGNSSAQEGAAAAAASDQPTEAQLEELVAPIAL